MSDERREMEAAQQEAAEQLRRVTEQEPLIRNEARAFSWLLQENHLSARFRKALAGG